jgi:hypothetical protein
MAMAALKSARLWSFSRTTFDGISASSRETHRLLHNDNLGTGGSSIVFSSHDSFKLI